MRLGSFPALLLHVKSMQHLMEERSDQETRDDQEYQTRVEGVRRSKQLACWRPKVTYRTHPSQEHGRVEQRVHPGQKREGVEPEDTTNQ